jgi:DNA-binding NarL/FixJ family response regulator
MIRVLLVDDCRAFSKAYSKLMSREPDLEVVGTLESADRLEPEAERLNPDIVIIDLSMPGRDPLEAMSQLAHRRPQSRTVVCSGTDDEETRLRVAQAGAWGLVPKVHNGRLGDMFDTIRRVSRGERCIDAVPGRPGVPVG